jgi:hypothetical protein
MWVWYEAECTRERVCTSTSHVFYILFNDSVSMGGNASSPTPDTKATRCAAIVRTTRAQPLLVGDAFTTKSHSLICLRARGINVRPLLFRCAVYSRGALAPLRILQAVPPTFAWRIWLPPTPCSCISSCSQELVGEFPDVEVSIGDIFEPLLKLSLQVFSALFACVIVRIVSQDLFHRKFVLL